MMGWVGGCGASMLHVRFGSRGRLLSMTFRRIWPLLHLWLLLVIFRRLHLEDLDRIGRHACGNSLSIDLQMVRILRLWQLLGTVVAARTDTRC